MAFELCNHNKQKLIFIVVDIFGAFLLILATILTKFFRELGMWVNNGELA